VLITRNTGCTSRWPSDPAASVRPENIPGGVRTELARRAVAPRCRTGPRCTAPAAVRAGHRPSLAPDRPALLLRLRVGRHPAPRPERAMPPSAEVCTGARTHVRLRPRIIAQPPGDPQRRQPEPGNRQRSQTIWCVWPAPNLSARSGVATTTFGRSVILRSSPASTARGKNINLTEQGLAEPGGVPEVVLIL
jgi:hypothetical protein